MRNRYRVLSAFFVFWLLSAATAQAGSSPSEAENLYKLKCAKCHRLYEPSDYDDQAWTKWMKKMRKKAHLSDEQFKLISGYLDDLKNQKERALPEDGKA